MEGEDRFFGNFFFVDARTMLLTRQEVHPEIHRASLFLSQNFQNSNTLFFLTIFLTLFQEELSREYFASLSRNPPKKYRQIISL